MAVIVYLYLAYCLREIARKRAIPYPWVAWIPLANVYLLCRIIGHGIVWTVLLLVPIINILFYFLACLKLAGVCGRRWWYGLLLVIPLVNLWALWRLAFGHLYPPGRGAEAAA